MAEQSQAGPGAQRSPAFDARPCQTTLFAAVLDAAAQYGKDKPILEDQERQPLAYGRLVLGALVLGDKLARITRRSETVGVLLPNVNGMPVTILALNAYGRVPALLNFTAGVRNLRSAAKTALIETVLTSRRFVDQANLKDVVAGLDGTETAPGKRLRIVYLDDIRKEIGTLDKLKGVVSAMLARNLHRKHALRPEQTAIVLFTSGTEGAPKGVALTNANVIANARQIYQHATGILGPTDIVLNPLPMFHSYGLTAGTLMPLLNGMKVVLYPSPLHYKQIPALIKATSATLLFATDTFMQGYARSAEPDDLKTVRYIIGGAERVKDQTRAMWARHGTTILEGYGATECAPVLACNLPDYNTPGSVGRLLPGLEYRLDPVEGITEGGRLMIRGSNVMAGYILPERPGVVVPPTDGWHDTGDIVTIDDAGMVRIAGRAKRFAKIGGEMISLAAVEGMVGRLWPDANHVVVSVPDPRKGEQLVLVTEKADADRDALQAKAASEGLPELWVPRQIRVVPSIPLLGSGKVDFPATIELVREAKAA